MDDDCTLYARGGRVGVDGAFDHHVPADARLRGLVVWEYGGVATNVSEHEEERRDWRSGPVRIADVAGRRALCTFWRARWRGRDGPPLISKPTPVQLDGRRESFAIRRCLFGRRGRSRRREQRCQQRRRRRCLFGSWVLLPASVVFAVSTTPLDLVFPAMPVCANKHAKYKDCDCVCPPVSPPRRWQWRREPRHCYTSTVGMGHCSLPCGIEAAQVRRSGR